jgi:hypothetical protein
MLLIEPKVFADEGNPAGFLAYAHAKYASMH